jgi:hypothetical protein
MYSAKVLALLHIVSEKPDSQIDQFYTMLKQHYPIAAALLGRLLSLFLFSNTTL